MGGITCSSSLSKYLLSTSKALKTGELSNLFDLEKAEHLQTACEIAHQETGSLTAKENVCQRDGESLTLVHWYVPLCPIDFVKTRFAA